VELRRASLTFGILEGEMNTEPFIVGIVGGVASGKSVVARRFGELGAYRISADETGHRLLADDPEVREKVLALLGNDSLDSDGNLDRSKIAAQVFGNQPERIVLRRGLEAILHPRIRAESERMIVEIGAANPRKMVLLDAPLLIEAGWLPRCRAIVFVDTPLELRQRFAAERGWDADELARRESNQVSLAEKRAAATHVIANHGSLEELLQAADRVFSELRSASD
jgi:dephospho-CoA kinase